MKPIALKDRPKDVWDGRAQEPAQEGWHVEAEAKRRSGCDAGAEQENGEFLLDRPCRADADDPDTPDQAFDQTNSSEQREPSARVKARARALAEQKGKSDLAGISHNQEPVPKRQTKT